MKWNKQLRLTMHDEEIRLFVVIHMLMEIKCKFNPPNTDRANEWYLGVIVLINWFVLVNKHCPRQATNEEILLIISMQTL